MKNKILTIIIPSYNVSSYIEKTLNTFAAEEIIDDLQILIVNDGSLDNTEEIALKYNKLYPESFFVISKENGGHGSTINTGIKMAKGKYIKVVDGDDWVDTNELISFISELKKLDSDLILTPFTRVYVDKNESAIVDIPNLIANKTYYIEEIILNLKDSLQMHSITFKTSILKKIQPLDEHCFYVDQEYVLFPLEYVKTAIYVPFNVYQYRLGIQEQSVNWNNLQKNRYMHKRVIESVLQQFNNYNTDDNLKKFINYRIQKLCERQIQIYLSLPTSNGVKEELKTFLNNVRESSESIYNNIPGKKAFVLRTFGINCYPVLSRIMKWRLK